MGCCGGPRQCSDFDSENEGLSAADLERFGGDDVACRSCGHEHYADVPTCPRCGVGVMGEDTATGGRGVVFPLVVVGMIALLLVVVLL